MRIELLHPDDINKCLPAAEKFHAIYDPEVPFSPGAFQRFWQNTYAAHNGFIIALWNEQREVVGGIGGILTNFVTSEVSTCVEMFWWVNPEHRGKWGMKLLHYFEEMARASGAARIAMAYMDSSMPDRMQKLYELLGYKPYEHHVMKVL